MILLSTSLYIIYFFSISKARDPKGFVALYSFSTYVSCDDGVLHSVAMNRNWLDAGGIHFVLLFMTLNGHTFKEN